MPGHCFDRVNLPPSLNLRNPVIAWFFRALLLINFSVSLSSDTNPGAWGTTDRVIRDVDSVAERLADARNDQDGLDCSRDGHLIAPMGMEGDALVFLNEHFQHAAEQRMKPW